MNAANRRFPLIFAMAAVAVTAIAVFHPNALDAQAQDAATDETARSEAGVTMMENHWSVAEYGGDTAWLEQMLLPEYRSVNNDGSVHTKQAIIAGAAKRKSTDAAKAQQQFDQERKTHPYGSAIVIHGDTAIISFYDPKLGPQKGIRSSDMFVYVDGHWHAIYSQHTALAF